MSKPTDCCKHEFFEFNQDKLTIISLAQCKYCRVPAHDYIKFLEAKESLLRKKLNLIKYQLRNKQDN
jgi:hypothetical protein